MNKDKTQIQKELKDLCMYDEKGYTVPKRVAVVEKEVSPTYIIDGVEKKKTKEQIKVEMEEINKDLTYTTVEYSKIEKYYMGKSYVNIDELSYKEYGMKSLRCFIYVHNRRLKITISSEDLDDSNSRVDNKMLILELMDELWRLKRHNTITNFYCDIEDKNLVDLDELETAVKDIIEIVTPLKCITREMMKEIIGNFGIILTNVVYVDIKEVIKTNEY